MSLNRKALRTRILAGAAAVTLSFSVVACSEAEDAASQAGDAAGSVVNDATAENESDAAESSAADSTEPAGSADASSTDGEGSGDTTEVETSDGSTMEIPSAVAAAAQAAGFSTLEDVEEGDNGETLATFAEGLIANSEESGAQPLVGKISETWVDEGGLSADIGLPTAPEEATDNGWTQSFTNGVINWVDNGSGDFSADIQTQ